MRGEATNLFQSLGRFAELALVPGVPLPGVDCIEGLIHRLRRLLLFGLILPKRFLAGTAIPLALAPS
jgi:hypothetical protein